jgi:adenylate cyclase
VARYDGLIHEFVGDEVIFYIKDKPNENSILKALSALRDINEVALRFSHYTQTQLGYSLTVKSSLAQGRLRFGHLVNGFTLAGAVLIETVRVLSQIVEKEDNLICFNQAYNRDLQPICELSKYAQVYLKGYPDKVTLVRYLRHQALSPLLQNPTEKNILTISYYRSNKDIAEILTALREQQQKYGDKVMLEIIKILSQFNLTQYYSNLAPTAPSQVADELLKLLETLAAESLAQGSQSHVLSAACKLVQNLMTAPEFESYFDLRFSRLLRHRDHRVVANAIDVIAFFQHEKSDQLLRPFLDHQNVRIAANTLVYEASRAITSEIVQRLKKSLNSQDPHIVAGSLYALGEIAQHHRNSDLVYYNSQVEFLNLINGISHFLNSTDPMVARQAAVAVRKSNLKLAA